MVVCLGALIQVEHRADFRQPLLFLHPEAMYSPVLQPGKQRQQLPLTAAELRLQQQNTGSELYQP
jgi:hypothetical protein